MTIQSTTAVDQALANDSMIADLLGDLEMMDLGDAELGMDSEEEIVEMHAADDDAVEMLVEAAISETDIIAEAIADAQRQTAKEEVYAEQVVVTLADGTAPETQPEALLAPADKKAKKVKVAKAPKEPKAPKEARATSITHAAGDLLMAKLGAVAADYLMFDLADADLPADELKAKQDAFITLMNEPKAVAKKVGEKMSMLVMWLVKGGELNVVLKRTFTLLAADGALTSGDKGNLHLNLLDKPLSKQTSRSQGCQMFMALPLLNICLKEKGRMIPNPNSPLLAMINAKLGL